MGDPLLVTARLASPLAGDAPHLDALMEYLMSLHCHKGVPGYKVDRRYSAPPQGDIPIPIWRNRVEGQNGEVWQIARCSSPILGPMLSETVEHICKRIGVEDATLLAEDARVIVTTSNSWTKSYRLPLRCRVIKSVAWFAEGNRREVFQLVKRARAIGKKIADGYGVVQEWVVDRVDTDFSWFAPSDFGLVLMRPMPIGPILPKDLVGGRRDFGAACPPYWHPERYTEIVVPC